MRWIRVDQSQSHWSLFNRMWQKRPRELDYRLRLYMTYNAVDKCRYTCHCKSCWQEYRPAYLFWYYALQYDTTHCNTMHHTALHCTTQTTHCNALQQYAARWQIYWPAYLYVYYTLQYTTTPCTTLQHTVKTLHVTATHCNTVSQVDRCTDVIIFKKKLAHLLKRLTDRRLKITCLLCKRAL